MDARIEHATPGRLAALALSVVLAATATANEGAAGKPNIVLFLADDVGYECFGCHGSEQYRTPEIDRLAREGLRFEHCYSQPLCTPSRVKIMTGLSNVRNYAAFSVLRRDQETFAHLLRDAGYATAVGGKWQLLGAKHYAERFRGKGTRPEQAGFDRHCLWQVAELGERFWGPLLTIDGEEREFAPEEYGPDVVTEYLLDFMEENRDGPFLVYYPMILGHRPFVPTPGSESRESRDRQRNFEDMVAHMDAIVGRFARKVEELGIAEDTLILFTSDNGTHERITSRLDGRTIRGGKGEPDDSGTRVPLVARWPGTIEPGRVTDQLVDFSDFVPTFQELAGAQVPAGLDGKSFAPRLRGEEGKGREWMFCYSNPRPEKTEPVRFVRDQRWKLYGDGRFFDVRSDPEERDPIEGPSGVPAHRKLRRALDSMPAEGQVLLEFGEG